MHHLSICTNFLDDHFDLHGETDIHPKQQNPIYDEFTKMTLLKFGMTLIENAAPALTDHIK
ncbi:MAG: hypothetical protein ACRCVV_03645 [Shewanella sp.]